MAIERNLCLHVLHPRIRYRQAGTPGRQREGARECCLVPLAEKSRPTIKVDEQKAAIPFQYKVETVP